jgi:anti-sigma factor ChrR (cupin superfamily)
MSLFSRMAPLGTPKIAVHRFGAALRQFAAGQLTRQQVIDAFVLSTAEIAELDSLVATYQAMGMVTVADAFAKAAWLDRMEDVFILVETGDYTEAKAKAALGY